MGPSGAGKSTLLNILSGYWEAGVHGALTENGRPRDPEEFRRRSCYIMQDDKLQPLLTVQETMFVAANLKLPSRMSPSEKGTRVKAILKALGLYDVRRTRSGKLSGGQRKRLAVALELVRNPPVMFFDEPTSGLDSLSSKQMVALLRELAREGRTVVCTIHQPSATLMEMFDHLYAVADGRCVYQGAVKGLLPFLEGNGLRCPPYHNPADYLLEVSRGEHGDVIDDLVMRSGNGNCQDWRRNAACEDARSPARPLSPPATPTDGLCLGPRSQGGYTASFSTQVCVLLRRAYLISSRDRQLTYSRVGLHLLIALIIGTLYFGIGRDAHHMLDNFNYLFFSIMFNMFTAFSSMVVAFADELPIVTREHFNRWYSVKSYLLAVTLADLPVQLLATFIYTLVTFYMTAQPAESFRFGLFLAMCYLVSLVAQSCGMLVSAALELKNACIFGPFAISPFLIFSGFFVHMKDAAPYMRWLFHTSFLKYGLEGVAHAVFGYDRGKMQCSSDYCHFVQPQKFLDQVGMDEARMTVDAVVLISLYFAIRLTTYAALVVRVSGKR